MTSGESSSEFSDSDVAPEHPLFGNNGQVPLLLAEWKGAWIRLIGAESFVKGHNAIREHEQYSDTVTQGPQPYDENRHRTHVHGEHSRQHVHRQSQHRGTREGCGYWDGTLRSLSNL
ncbi:uncharacterized protein A4U43_C05F22600 [Asparagus officinalis]|uniref:Uncharacterized protein n=1 Tax=Asparagus officinalis TaxID=4686 RepID=A0A5P1EV21_ASPOF|nr:uncharacterized protein A4U43_C05F22600 [Asparagus officinalis]